MISKCLIAVRIAGRVGLSKDVEDTLRLLHLTRANHATILISSPSQLGMLQKVKDYVTWGEGIPKTVTLLIRCRGEFVGGIKLTDEGLAERSSFKSVDDLAGALCSGDAVLKDVEGLRPLFRLHPPRGGFRGSRKKAFVTGGEVGYRGEAIADLLSSMV
jgi:large subunit ribosomal protein L30